MRKVAVVVGAIVTQRFAKEETPLSCNQLAIQYKLPMRLVSDLVDRMHSLNLINFVTLENDDLGVAPAVDISNLTAGILLKKLDTLGDSDFIPTFDENFGKISEMVTSWESDEWESADKILLKDIPVATPETTA